MPASSPWNSVAFGFTLKLVAMWMILPALLIPFVFPSHLGLLFAVLLPLLIDVVGRCYCAWSPVAGTLNIRLSILAQITGVLRLTASSLFFVPGGVIFGLAWAAVFQVCAAKFFLTHLRAIALNIGQPTITVGLDQLRQRLIATSLSFYSSGMISVIVLSCAVVFGLMTFGLGFIITIPLAFLILMPLVTCSMLLYFLMLYSYERSLSELRNAVHAWSETNALICGLHCDAELENQR